MIMVTSLYIYLLLLLLRRDLLLLLLPDLRLRRRLRLPISSSGLAALLRLFTGPATALEASRFLRFIRGAVGSLASPLLRAPSEAEADKGQTELGWNKAQLVNLYGIIMINHGNCMRSHPFYGTHRVID